MLISTKPWKAIVPPPKARTITNNSNYSDVKDFDGSSNIEISLLVYPDNSRSMYLRICMITSFYIISLFTST